MRLISAVGALSVVVALAQYSPPSGGGGGGATIPKTTHIICGDNNGNGALCTPDLTPATAITFAQGAIASLPSCTTTLNEIYKPTDSYYDSITCLTGASSWTYFLDGKQAVPPTAANTWTVVNGNSGTASLTNSKGAIVLSTTSGVIGIEAALKAVPSAPYAKTLAFRFQAYTSNNASTFNQIQCGAIWSAGTSTSSANSVAGPFLSTTSAGSTVIGQIAINTLSSTNFTYGSAAPARVFGMHFLNPSNTLWFQFVDDNTNRSINISVDGINFVTLYGPTSRTSPFTPADYGIACAPQNNSAGAGVPWEITLLSDN